MICGVTAEINISSFESQTLGQSTATTPGFYRLSLNQKLLRSNSSSGGPRSVRVVLAPGAPRKVCRLTGQLWPDLAPLRFVASCLPATDGIRRTVAVEVDFGQSFK